jgi:hypothetical protein
MQSHAPFAKLRLNSMGLSMWNILYDSTFNRVPFQYLLFTAFCTSSTKNRGR